MLAIATNLEPQSDRLVAGEPLPVAVGDTVGGKYVVDAIIGVGGMGVVASATHVALGQRVALKVMRSARMNPETADRFLREARAASSLKSSHVAKVLDVGTLGSGLPYMVMELLEGSDLSSQLEARGALPCAEAVDYVLQACDALSEAHALGIVHRDLKPENLFVTERRDGTPLVKVLDFGISKVIATIEISESSAPRRAITHESTVMGSPLYMSPEQVRSAKHVDGRSDIWALGAILFELVAGRSAFHADSVPDIFVKILEKAAPRLEDAVRDPPPGLAETIARCLEKDRDKRFQTVDELAAALANLGVRPVAATVPPWDRSVEIAMDENGDGDLVGVAASAPIVIGATGISRPRHVAAETFVLPGRARSRGKTAAWVVFCLVLCGGGAAAGVVHRQELTALVAPKAAAAPAAAPAPTTARTADPVVESASAVAVTPPSGVSEPAAATSRAAAEQHTALTRGTSGGRPRVMRSGAKPVAAAAAPEPPPAVAEPVAPAPPAPPAPTPAPAPTLRRTDW